MPITICSKLKPHPIMFNWFKRKAPPTQPSPKPTCATSVRITLPQDRTEYARIVAFSTEGEILGSWIGLAKADPTAATMANNPTCDWKLRFGETPTGEYELAEIRQPKDTAEISALGAGRYLVLNPLSGNAAIAEAHGRTTLLIHGGNAQPTDGSIRLPDRALAELVSLITNQLRVSIKEATAPLDQTQANRTALSYDWQYQDSDDSSSLFSYYCQYYAWSSLFNSSSSGSLFNDPPTPTPSFDPDTLAAVNVLPLPESPRPTNPSNLSVINQAVENSTNLDNTVLADPPQAPIELERPDPQPGQCEAPDPAGDTAYGR